MISTIPSSEDAVLLPSVRESFPAGEAGAADDSVAGVPAEGALVTSALVTGASVGGSAALLSTATAALR